MQDTDDYRLDKHQVRAAFDRSAALYDGAAVLQREVGQRLLERLDLIKIQPGTVLDVGSGTGFCSEALLRRYPKANVVALDLAHSMLRQHRGRQPWWRRRSLWPWRARQSFVCADAETLPLADASVDLIVSNLTLQWCVDLDRTFGEFRRVLAPGGLLLFTTFGPDTLKELRESWSRADGYTHVHAFIDMHDIGDALVRSQFDTPVMDMEYLTVTYPDVTTLMRDLKHIGAHNASGGRPRGLTGRGRLRAVSEAYEAHRRDGVLPATHEVVYGHAWAPTQPLAQPRTDGVATVSLEQVRAGMGQRR
ncbi:MAG TPA: malonyl-ACP O-methyltransferase BioC [Gammaproteobacteria bacterium]|nr:malonyl-ACP O-methyltransferase BioC [Gammaproteobacteria bacterium]